MEHRPLESWGQINVQNEYNWRGKLLNKDREENRISWRKNAKDEFRVKERRIKEIIANKMMLELPYDVDFDFYPIFNWIFL